MNAAISTDATVTTTASPGSGKGRVLLLNAPEARVVTAAQSLLAAMDTFSKAATREQQARAYLTFVCRHQRLQLAITQYHES